MEYGVFPEKVGLILLCILTQLIAVKHSEY